MKQDKEFSCDHGIYVPGHASHMLHPVTAINHYNGDTVITNLNGDPVLQSEVPIKAMEMWLKTTTYITPIIQI